MPTSAYYIGHQFLSLQHHGYPVSKCVEKSIRVSYGALQCVIYILLLFELYFAEVNAETTGPSCSKHR